MVNLLYGKKGSAVGVNPKFADGRNFKEIVEDLREQVLSVEMWLLDLDGTYASYPGIDAAKAALGTNYTNKEYLEWMTRSGLGFLRSGGNNHSEAWFDYIDRFLDSEGRREAQKYFTPKRVRESLHEDTINWRKKLNNNGRIFVTRNIAEITYPYAIELDVEAAYLEVKDKAQVVREIVANFKIDKFGVEGDTIEDAVMIDEVRRLGKRALGIQVMKRINGTALDSFDVYTTRDRGALLEILRFN